jgi:signal recognition particle receptor subunit alpha
VCQIALFLSQTYYFARSTVAASSILQQPSGVLPQRSDIKRVPKGVLYASSPSPGKHSTSEGAMIDDFTIFSRSGLVLWRKRFVKLRGDPLARLVQTVLLEDRAALPELICDGYTVRWVLANDVGLVFSLVFQTSLPPAYGADLLSSVKIDFVRRFADGIADPTADDFDAFAPHFERLLTAAEEKSLSRAAAARKARAVERQVFESAATALQREPLPEATDPASITGVSDDGDVALESEAPEDAEEVIRKNREAFMRRKSGGSGRSKKQATAAASAAVMSAAVPKRGKVMRSGAKVSSEEIAALDFSSEKTFSGTDMTAAAAASDAEVSRFREQFLEAQPNTRYDVMDVADEDEARTGENSSSVARGGVLDFFKGLAGMKNLTREDLESALGLFRDALIGKNVAQEIADKLIESVAVNLEGKRMESMTTVSSTVRQALDEALTRILTPRQSVDILAEISAKRGSGRPYVITFCGVNGVGKSTSLAKICFFLLNNGCKVMIAACDTFRAGAVEQLRTHVRCLGDNVELFDRGYGKDAAAVAMDAIRKAKELHYDVVLVDTAGRMQHNEPLMRALSKLVEVNQPDRLFFVGEALVGNDAVDQVAQFNASLADHQVSANPRLIDGIVLTKFDTIDDKVGAAVSMVYTTGQPIVFVGVGQTYMDLRKVQTRLLVKALLK